MLLWFEKNAKCECLLVHMADTQKKAAHDPPAAV